MTNATHPVITGVGERLPDRRVTNDDLAKLIDTSDEWIQQRTGIKERRFVEEGGETPSDLGSAALRVALKQADMPAEALGGIIAATCTPEYMFPSTAAQIQNKVGAAKNFAFDVSAACAGFVYGLTVADALMRRGVVDGPVAVVGTEVVSRVINMEDRGSAVLFGDGAGAVILRPTEQANGQPRGLLASTLRADGENAGIVHAPRGMYQGDGSIVHMGIIMDGQKLFKVAVEALADTALKTLAKAGMTVDDVDCFVPHQANARIIAAVGRRLNIPSEKVVMTVQVHGNTSAASIPLALCEADRQGRLTPGAIVLMSAIGGGLSWGSAVMRW